MKAALLLVLLAQLAQLAQLGGHSIWKRIIDGQEDIKYHAVTQIKQSQGLAPSAYAHECTLLCATNKWDDVQFILSSYGYGKYNKDEYELVAAQTVRINMEYYLPFEDYCRCFFLRVGTESFFLYNSEWWWIGEPSILPKGSDGYPHFVRYDSIPQVQQVSPAATATVECECSIQSNPDIDSSTCNAVDTFEAATNGEITVASNYQSGLYCSWIINTYQGHSITLINNEFETRADEKVRFYKKTEDGNWSEVRTSSNNIWSSTEDTAGIINVTSTVKITFESNSGYCIDLNRPCKGFKFSWYVDMQRRSPVSERCAVNMVTDNALSSCIECDGGRIADTNQISCVCAKGKVWRYEYYDNSFRCRLCSWGTYTHNDECKSCDMFYTTVGEGSSLRTDCMPQTGYHLPPNTSQEQWPTPQKCPVDTYKDTVSVLECTACPYSTTRGQTGVTHITWCTPLQGYEWVGGFGHSVQLCKPTHYKNTISHDACEACTGGKVGSADRRECVCAPGFLTTGSLCVACQVGTYSNEANTACLSCRVNLTTTAEASTSVAQCMPKRGFSSELTGTITGLQNEPYTMISSNEIDFDEKHTGVSYAKYLEIKQTVDTLASFATQYCSYWNPDTIVVIIAEDPHDNTESEFTIDGNTGTYSASCLSSGNAITESTATRRYFRTAPEPCPVNTYKDSMSMEACTRCPEHSTTTGTVRATNKKDCLAEPGYEWDGTEPQEYVKQCDDTSFKSTVSNDKCSQCPNMPDGNLAASILNHTDCHCGKTAWHDKRRKICQSCQSPFNEGNVVEVDYIENSNACQCGEKTYLGVQRVHDMYEYYDIRICKWCPMYWGTLMITNPAASRDNSLNDCQCPADHYRYETGIGCVKCPMHATSDAYSTALQDCVCPPGLHLALDIYNTDVCEECPVNTYEKHGLCQQCDIYHSTLGRTGQVNCTCLGEMSDLCDPCDRGSFYNQASEQCEQCAEDTYVNETGAEECTPCAAGKYSNKGMTACITCVGNTSWNGDMCVANAGFQPSGQSSGQLSGDHVEPCPAGTYKDTAGNKECDPCAAGTFMQETGATACTPCAAGMYNDLMGQIECIECEPGSSAGSMGSKLCSLCVKGTFANETGATTCTPCAVGTYGDSEGRAACTSCLSGSTTVGTGSTAAESCFCMANFFGSLVNGNVYCDPCHANAVSVVGQNTAPTDCKCRAGWFGNDGGVCESCPNGKYKDTVGSVPCVDCTGAFVTSPAGSTTAAACGCQPGYGGSYGGSSGGTPCTACLPGKYKASVGFGGCTNCPSDSFQPSPGSSACHPCWSHWVDGSDTSAPPGSSRCYCRGGNEFRCRNESLDEHVCNTYLMWCMELRAKANDYTVCQAHRSPDGSVDCGMCQCWPCPAGTYRPWSSGADYVDRCIVCPAGKFGTTTGAWDATSCTDCGPGTYSSPNGTMCLACPAGKTSGAGSGRCSCDAGFEFSNANTECEPCRVDFFKADASDRGCDKCAAGTGTSGVGALACDVALPGYADISPLIASQVEGFNVIFDEDRLQVPKGSRFAITPLVPTHFRTGTSNVFVLRLRVLPSEDSQTNANLLSISHPGERGLTVAIPAMYWATDELLARVQTAGTVSAAVLRSQKKNSWKEWLTFHIHYTVDSLKLHMYLELTKLLYSSWPLEVPINPPLPIGYSPTFEIGGSSKVSPPVSGFAIEISHMFFSSHAGDFANPLELTAESFANCSCLCPSTGPSAGFVNVLARECGITPCPPGMYKPDRGAFRCLPCPEGATSLPASKALADCKCTLPGYAPGPLGECACAPGFERSGTACVACSVGTAGSGGACEPCAAGKFQDLAAQALCKPCARGSAQAATGQTACAACVPGYKQPDQGRQACVECAAGTFQAHAGQTACAACGPGAFQPTGGATACAACLPGSFQPTGGATACVLCEPGHAQEATGQTACTACAPGHAQPEAGQATCVVCGPGAFQSATGATECVGCSPGSYAAGGGAECMPCAPGSYQEDGEETSCKACVPGTFQNASGASACLACREGSVAPNASQTACAACAAGTFAAEHACAQCAPGSASGAGAAACEQCAPGKFQDASGQSECTPCLAGTASAARGASAAATCVACGPGNHSGPGAAACMPCPPGTFSVGSACEPCAAGLYQPLAGAADRSACRQCLPPSYSQTPGSPACAECRNGTLLTADADEGAETVVVGVGCLHNCSAGERSGSAPGDYGCHPCPRGAAQPLALHRAGECLPCAPGQDTPGEGASACACARGWEPGPDAACRACAPPWFKNWVGDDPCLECRRERNELPELMTSAEKCPCAAGFFDAGLQRRCEACPTGAYTAGTGSEGPGSCSVCLWLHMTNDCPGAGPCQCADGFVRTLSGCEFCPGCPCGSVERRTGAAGRPRAGFAWLAVLWLYCLYCLHCRYCSWLYL